MTLSELEKYFSEANLPEEPIQLDKHTKITNVRKFVDSHLEVLRGNSGNKTFMPYYNRLMKLKNFI